MNPYRANRIDNGKVVFGSHFEDARGFHFIIPKGLRACYAKKLGWEVGFFYEVHPASLAQNTTVKDKDDKPIFGSFEVEDKKLSNGGDILMDNQGNVGNVIWVRGGQGWVVNWHRKDGTYDTDTCLGYGKIIGTQWKGTE